MGQELRHLAGPAVLVEEPVPRILQFPHHLDQRHPIEPDAQIVEHRGGFGVAERAKFLDVAQPDGEDVVENRLVDVGQQGLQQVLALTRAVRAVDRHRIGIAGRGLVVVTADLKAAAGGGHVERAAGPTAGHRGQIAPPRGREAVEHRADEFQQRRLAGLVGPIEDVQAVRQVFELQVAPNAETVYFQRGDSHDWGSSPLNRSTPKRAASRSTRSRTAGSERSAATPRIPA